MSEQDSGNIAQESGDQPAERDPTGMASIHTNTERTDQTQESNSSDATADSQARKESEVDHKIVGETLSEQVTKESIPNQETRDSQSTDDEGCVLDDAEESVAELTNPPTTEATPQRVSIFEGHVLFEHEWRPEEDIKAVIHICHGIHEHMGRYKLLAEHLKDNGILVRAIDLVGHGRSGGDRGHIDSIESYVTDVINHIKDTKTEFPQLPLFLMGHSNGGAVAIGITLRIQEMLSGLVLSAPAIVIQEGKILQLAAKIVAYIFPQAGLRAFDESFISSIPEEVEQYNNDPLIYRGSAKASWAAALFRAVDDYQPHLQEFKLPLLVIHGTDDRMVPIAASDLVINTATSTDKTFERFEGSRHEVLHDKEQDRARQLISQWLLTRLSQPVHDSELSAK